jgi:hypothetical protein
MAFGSAIGGVISEKVSPSFALSITTASIGLGFIILGIGRKRLAAADRLPSDEEDLLAMEDNAPTTR